MLELFTRSEDCNTDLCMKMASSNLATETKSNQTFIRNRTHNAIYIRKLYIL